MRNGNPKFRMYEHALVETESMRMLAYEKGTVDEVFAIPNGIKIIERLSVRPTGSNKLKKIVIPDSVEELGNGAFTSVYAETVEIGSGIKKMGFGVFDHSSALRTVTISEGTTCIGMYAFNSCINLETVTIPDSVTSIGQDAFKDCYRVRIIANPGSYAAEYAEANDLNNSIFEDYGYEIKEGKVKVQLDCKPLRNRPLKMARLKLSSFRMAANQFHPGHLQIVRISDMLGYPLQLPISLRTHLKAAATSQ